MSPKRRTPMLGSDLKAVREKLGYSVRDLAGLAGLSPEAVSAIERGNRYPNLHTLECLAKVLHIKIIVGPDETVVEQD